MKRKSKNKKEKIVYVAMCGDLMHHGHVNIFKTAAKYGTVTVGLLTDQAVESFKRSPILNYKQRKQVVGYMKGVTKVIPQRTLDYTQNLRRLKPDFVVHGDDWKNGVQSQTRQKVINELKKWGGKLIEPHYTKSISTTKLIAYFQDNGIVPLGWGQSKKQRGATPQKEIFGVGSRNKFPKLLKDLNAKKVFVVTGHSSYKKLDKKYGLSRLFSELKVEFFSDFKNNPQLRNVTEAATRIRHFKPDVVISIGGGSAIDVGKSGNILAVQDERPESYIRGKNFIEYRGKPFIAVPTTSGTGSEATHFAVIYDNLKKCSLSNLMMRPDVAIVDPELTFELPKEVAASTGLDALSQAVESYWSVRASTESKKYASEAIELLMKYLVNSVNNKDKKSRIAVSRAAFLAGKAINLSFTTVPHAVANPLTALFGIPHGIAVGLTLPAMITFNSKVTKEDLQDERGLQNFLTTFSNLLKLLGVKKTADGAKKISSIMKAMDVKTHLGDYGVKLKDIDKIISYINFQRIANNPRLVTKQDLQIILKNLL